MTELYLCSILEMLLATALHESFDSKTLWSPLLLLPAELLNKSLTAANRSELTANTITGCPLPLPLCPSEIHHSLHRAKLSSELRAHSDGREASCQADQGGCGACCSQRGIEQE